MLRRSFLALLGSSVIGTVALGSAPTRVLEGVLHQKGLDLYLYLYGDKQDRDLMVEKLKSIVDPTIWALEFKHDRCKPCEPYTWVPLNCREGDWVGRLNKVADEMRSLGVKIKKRIVREAYIGYNQNRCHVFRFAYGGAYKV